MEHHIEFAFVHDGQAYQARVTICPGCLQPAVLRLATEGGTAEYAGGGLTLVAARAIMPEHTATPQTTNGQAAESH